MSDAQDAVNDLLAEYESKLTNVAPTSVGIQLGLMAILSVLTILAFSVLRPKNKVSKVLSRPVSSHLVLLACIACAARRGLRESGLGGPSSPFNLVQGARV